MYEKEVNCLPSSSSSSLEEEMNISGLDTFSPLERAILKD